MSMGRQFKFNVGLQKFELSRTELLLEWVWLKIVVNEDHSDFIGTRMFFNRIRIERIQSNVSHSSIFDLFFLWHVEY